jgi:hypothetical protein
MLAGLRAVVEPVGRTLGPDPRPTRIRGSGGSFTYETDAAVIASAIVHSQELSDDEQVGAEIAQKIVLDDRDSGATPRSAAYSSV